VFMDSAELLEKLHTIDRESRCLERAAAVLHWDQETCLPEKGVDERSEQLALLEGIAHGRLTSLETGRLLSELGSVSDNPGGDEKLLPLERDFLRVFRRNYDRAVKLPGDFVAAAAKAEGLSQAAWARARRDNDFPAFLPHLRRMIDFARRKAVYWGYADKALSPAPSSPPEPPGTSVYDGLLDSYEPGMTAEAVRAVFGPLGERLSALIRKIASCPRPDASFLNRDFDAEGQARFSRELMGRLGFDFRRGRVDTSAHPFTTTLGSDDIRITTRYLPRQVQSGIFSTIHETGHALYEMAFPPEIRGTCLADGASMGIHESQSRFWENVIGRSAAFWEALFPLLASCFPEALSPITARDFYRAINLVEPSLIRIEADEVSYSLHIILRFELEEALFSGALEAADLPELWRKKMKDFLGVEPQTDAEGVLQDIHWSMGSFGYFPSYALGNLYGLQFWEKLKADIPGADGAVARGDFAPLRTWLEDTIYVWGRRLPPPELLKAVTGKSLSAEPFLDYIEGKYAGIYGF
jgi:carboxypeptidase Taq